MHREYLQPCQVITAREALHRPDSTTIAISGELETNPHRFSLSRAFVSVADGGSTGTAGSFLSAYIIFIILDFRREGHHPIGPFVRLEGLRSVWGGGGVAKKACPFHQDLGPIHPLSKHLWVFLTLGNAAILSLAIPPSNPNVGAGRPKIPENFRCDNPPLGGGCSICHWVQG